MEHQKNNADFYPMPFQRIFVMLFYELCAPEAVLESINWHTLMAFSNAYHYLNPIKGRLMKTFKVITDSSTGLCLLMDGIDRIQNVRDANDAT